MSEVPFFPGRYFDGRVARSRDVVVALEPRRVEISDPVGELLESWPTDAVRLIEKRRRGQPLRLGNGLHDAARLTIDHPDAYATLSAHCPNLDRVDGRFRDRWKSVAIWGGGAVLSIAVILLVGWPLLAGLIARAVPAETERAWGEDIADEMTLAISRRFGGEGRPAFCNTPEGTAALDRLVARIGDHAALPFPLNVRVVDLPVENAFTLPGGQIVVFSGLIERAEDSGELAGVLAHEIGHVVHRHPFKRAIEQSGAATMLSFLVGDVSGSTLIVVGTQLLLLSSYSRDDEREADAAMISLLNGSGIDTAPAANFFDRLAAQEDADETAISLVGTHPLSRERAQALRDQSSAKGAAMPGADWQALRAICDRVDETDMEQSQ